MGVRQLNFNDSLRNRPVKTLGSDALSQGLIMVKLQVTNMEYSGVFGYPYKYLPVMSVSSEKPGEMGTTYGKEGIVLPKGTIVSLLTNQTTIATYGSTIHNATASGTIPVYLDQLNSDTLVTAPTDDSFFGYDESVTGLLVPANGGAQSTIPYSSLDDELDGWSASTDSRLVIGANIPIGIVVENVYQDIRGKYNNYVTHDAVSPIIGGRIDVPYVDTSKIDFGEPADVTAATDSGYYRLWRKWQFLYFNGAAYGRSGIPVKSDAYGKFVPESNSVTANKTVQTVGRILTTDSRYPKDLSQAIQNYPGSQMMGVNTGGVPTDLYLFAKDTMTALGLTADKTTILQMIQYGAFGFAKIQLSCNR